MAEQQSQPRNELDPVFKQVLIELFKSLPVTVKTEVEVSRLPRTIDALVMVESSDTLDEIASTTPFGHFRQSNQIEFKGRNDRLTQWGFYRILGRSYLYLGEHKIDYRSHTITIVCAGKPRTVLQTLEISFEQVKLGIYRASDQLQITIIVANELENIPENYALLLFASSKIRFQEVLTQILNSSSYTYYLYFAFEIRPQETKELIEMQRAATAPKETLPQYLASRYGVEIVKFIEPELMLKQLPPELMLKQLTSELNSKTLSPDERAAYIQALSTTLAKLTSPMDQTDA